MTTPLALPAPPGAGIRKCQAFRYPWTVPCGRPAIRAERVECACGHVRKRWVCADHSWHGRTLCRECWEADGHSCPVTCTPVEAA